MIHNATIGGTIAVNWRNDMPEGYKVSVKIAGVSTSVLEHEQISHQNQVVHLGVPTHVEFKVNGNGLNHTKVPQYIWIRRDDAEISINNINDIKSMACYSENAPIGITLNSNKDGIVILGTLDTEESPFD